MTNQNLGELISQFDGNMWGQQCLINGDWVGEPSLNVVNPHTGRTVTVVPNLGHHELLSAIKSAASALNGWADLSPKKKAQILSKWARNISQNKYSYGQILSSEQGKQIDDAVSEVEQASQCLEYCSNLVQHQKIDELKARLKEDGFGIPKTLGVVGIMTGSDRPLANAIEVLAPALAIGYTVVLMPSITTPFSALSTGASAERANLPAGVLNIITSDSYSLWESMEQHDAVVSTWHKPSNERALDES